MGKHASTMINRNTSRLGGMSSMEQVRIKNTNKTNRFTVSDETDVIKTTVRMSDPGLYFIH